MKNALLLLFCAAAVSVQSAQTPAGQIFFVTSNAGSNPVFDVNGTTPLGTGFFGQLYVGSTAGSLQAVGTPLQFSVNNAGAGFIADPSTGVTWAQTLNSTSMPVGGQAGVYVLRAWAGSVGSTFETASVTGSSAATSVASFGGVDGTGTPVFNFPIANGHASFALVPEPATMALGLFGAAGLLFRRRK